MHRPTDDMAERVDSVKRTDATDGVVGADRVATHHVAEGDTAARADMPEMPQMARTISFSDIVASMVRYPVSRKGDAEPSVMTIVRRIID